MGNAVRTYINGGLNWTQPHYYCVRASPTQMDRANLARR